MASGQTVDTSRRLAALRELLERKTPKIDVFVLLQSSSDFSEYPSRSDERRAFISGFNGSAGCAVVTDNNAYLFTDGRYFLQASQQLDKNWTLMKQGLPDVPTWQEFISTKLESGKRIGIDPSLISAADAKSLRESLQKKDSELASLDKNPVDVVWGDDRPARIKNKVFHLDVKYSGRSSQEKLTALREQLTKKKTVGMVVNMLDEVAWLFNLRGSDIDFNPVFLAYAVVTLDKAVLFVDSEQITDPVRAHLGKDVEIQPYDSILSYLKELSNTLGLSENKRFLLGNNASLAIADAIGIDNALTSPSPVADAKAIKNSTEITGFRESHVRDGAALARYFAWLEAQLDAGAQLSESEAADKLAEYRSELDLFKGLSFPTISSTGPNGAIIHYEPEPGNCATIRKDQIYLCDSGAQFIDGTTDVTRTWHFGTPTEEEKRAFTRVLQGHIAIDTLVFPNGTTGFAIDPIARLPLWQDGLDYRHGTGHGVGHFLNVHEGPHGIGQRIAYNNTPLKAGMTVSNEPGFYKDGHFGIRIENVVIVREAQTPNNFGDKGYLSFEHVTMCPIQTKLVAQELLSPAERVWLNAYHEEVHEKIAPLLANDPRALAWLARECAAI
ncbi:Creatinase/aminopeptidase [Phellopilus nigrolimitatus]|nr:Creatinase/aminopeptidase [Phellopilus nigrolimitatus]